MAKQAPIDDSNDKYAEMRKKLRDKFDANSAPTTQDLEPRAMSTGIPQLDEALGIGGLPRGRIIDVYGEEAVGKTALHMLIAKNILAKDKSAQIAWLDLEHKFSVGLARVVGLDPDQVLIIHPPSAEAAFEQGLDLIGDYDSYRTGKSKTIKPLDMFDLVVFDSVAAAVTDAENMSEVGDVNVAGVAKLMADVLKKMVHPLFTTRTVFSFINQMRADIKSQMRMYGGGGKTEKPTGGKALKFFASVRLEIKKSEYVKEGTTIVGLNNEILIVKNGVSEPFRTAKYVFNFKHGIDLVTMLVEEALMKKVISTAGSYFSFGEGEDVVKWLGKEKMISAFRADSALLAKLSAILGR